MPQQSFVPSNHEPPLLEKPGAKREYRSGRSPLWWWYRWTALDEPGQNAMLIYKERFRRGRLASVILLMMLLTVIAFIPLALASANPLTLPIVLALLAICCLALFLNRLGYATLVGIFIVISVDAALVLTILTPHPINLNINSLPVFDLFVLPELVAVSILPAASVFLVALANCGYIVASVLLMPRSADLALLMVHSSYSVVLRPVALQAGVALVTYLWVRNAREAIIRADRAEVIAHLEHTIADQKRNLDFGIQQLLNTLVHAANGDTSVRSPLSQENVLWRVAISLNTLLARLQRFSQSEQELKQLKTEVNYVVIALRDVKTRRVAFPVVPAGTPVDPLYRELSGHYVLPPRQITGGSPSQW